MRSIKHKAAKRAAKQIMAVAASVTIVLGISATAYATRMFGINKLVVTTPAPSALQTIEATSPSPTTLEEKEDKSVQIFVQGWQESPEAMAAGEWDAFYENYDQDGKIISKIGNGETKFDKKYGVYSVYSQEMADKIEEITKKYGLKLHKSRDIIDTSKPIDKLLGAKFLEKGNELDGGYMYEDGSFSFDGTAYVVKGKEIGYQFSDLKKGMFTDILLATNGLEDYKQWTYQTKDGQRVLLAISSDRSLIVTERDKSFVLVNVLAGRDDGEDRTITKDDLEKIADTFHYSLLK